MPRARCPLARQQLGLPACVFAQHLPCRPLYGSPSPSGRPLRTRTGWRCYRPGQLAPLTSRFSVQGRPCPPTSGPSVGWSADTRRASARHSRRWCCPPGRGRPAPARRPCPGSTARWAPSPARTRPRSRPCRRPPRRVQTPRCAATCRRRTPAPPRARRPGTYPWRRSGPCRCSTAPRARRGWSC